MCKNSPASEFEAVRFKDYRNIKQTEAAEFMSISQSTFHRILNSARNKLDISLIEGRRIVIMEGDTVIDSNKYSLVKSRKRVWRMSGL